MNEASKRKLSNIDLDLNKWQARYGKRWGKAQTQAFNDMRDALMRVVRPVKWTRGMFLANTGRLPEDDDLERTNCDEAGTMGHQNCGVCEHNRPVFMCPNCFANRQHSSHT